MVSPDADLNHWKISPFTREVAAELALEHAFVEFVFSPSKPACFRYWCEPPEHGWSVFVPDEWEVAYPVWSCNANQTLLLRSGDTYSFAAASHDDSDVDHIARTPQGLLASLFIVLWEQGKDETSLRAAAAACGFRYFDEVLDFEARENRSRDYYRARERFLANIDEKSS